MALEKVGFNIPADSNWTIEDLEKKAEALGLQNKSELMVMAVDAAMNFDMEVAATIQRMADGLKIPAWMVVQNMLIKQIAEKKARESVFGNITRILPEFTAVTDKDGNYRMLTGKDLMKTLFDMYQIKEQREETDRQQALDAVFDRLNP
jgi:hypothetical protein